MYGRQTGGSIGQRLSRREFPTVAAASVGCLFTAGSNADQSDTAVTIMVHTDQRIGTMDPRIFGYMTEETLTSYAGGISSEMLFDRKSDMPGKRDIAAGIEERKFKGTGAGWEPLDLSKGITLVQDEQVYYGASQS